MPEGFDRSAAATTSFTDARLRFLGWFGELREIRADFSTLQVFDSHPDKRPLNFDGKSRTDDPLMGHSNRIGF
jgi:hypothetical protein